MGITAWDVYRPTPKMKSHSTLLANFSFESLEDYKSSKPLRSNILKSTEVNSLDSKDFRESKESKDFPSSALDSLKSTDPKSSESTQVSKVSQEKNFKFPNEEDSVISESEESKGTKDLKVLGEEPWKWRTNLSGLVLSCSVKNVSYMSVKIYICSQLGERDPSYEFFRSVNHHLEYTRCLINKVTEFLLIFIK